MTKSPPDDLDEAIAAVEPRIKQPKLKDLEPGERVIRTAGLKFIVKCPWKPGDTLDETSALLLNTAWHTAALNRFSETRKVLLENPDCSYEDLDKALQAHLENFSYTPRPLDTSDPTDPTDEDRELISYARPIFNKVVGGKGIERKQYEEMLREFVTNNRVMLLQRMRAEQQAMSKLTEDLAGALGE